RVTRDREVESLEQAVRWPNATVPVVMQLANAWLSTHRYADGYAWFAPLANERPLFEALAGVFQANSAGEVPLLDRVAWVEQAIARLDHAAAQDGLSRYLRGVVFVALPDRFGKTAEGVGSVDAGTVPAPAAKALAAVRARADLPIRKVIVTHAHWDHIGGLSAFATPGVEVIAQARFRNELARVNDTGVPFHIFGE